MKATLTFMLPEEQAEYDCAYKGSSYAAALDAIAEAFRQQKKYNGFPVTEEGFYSILDDFGVSIK